MTLPSSPPPRLSQPRIQLADLIEEYRKQNSELEEYLTGVREACTEEVFLGRAFARRRPKARGQ